MVQVIFRICSDQILVATLNKKKEKIMMHFDMLQVSKDLSYPLTRTGCYNLQHLGKIGLSFQLLGTEIVQVLTFSTVMALNTKHLNMVSI